MGIWNLFGIPYFGVVIKKVKYIGLLGYPLSHSVSPHFQQAALSYYKLDILYEPWEVAPPDLEKALKKARKPSCLGLNVTIPYKEAVIPYLDKLEGKAMELRAVNTIVNQEGKLIGYNTDAQGFLKALHLEGAFNPAGKRAAILGCGGAGRAISFALCWEKISELLLVNRTRGKAESLQRDLNIYAVKTTLVEWYESSRSTKFKNCDLIVNCTSIGMKNSQERSTPLIAKDIEDKSLVFDLVYNPLETRLIQEARKAGARAIGGLSMLIYQGAEAFKLWTGLEPPLEIMFKSAREALRTE